MLDVSAASGKSLTVRWLDIRACRWVVAQEHVDADVDQEGFLRLVTPREEGYWVALVSA